MARASQSGFRRRAEDSVVADFGGAPGKNVLEKASDELDPRQRDALHLLGTVIAIAETDHAVVDGFQAAVGDGDSEDVASQVVENLVATSGVLRMNDPSFLPGRHWDAGKQSSLFQSRAKLGAEDDR